MKTKNLLLFASVAVLTTIAGAAQDQAANEAVVLPAYVVTAPRYLPAEVKVNTSLAEFRQQAKAPVAIVVECPALKAAVNPGSGIALKARPEKSVRIAKG
jgi:hypothetical protein